LFASFKSSASGYFVLFFEFLGSNCYKPFAQDNKQRKLLSNIRSLTHATNISTQLELQLKKITIQSFGCFFWHRLRNFEMVRSASPNPSIVARAKGNSALDVKLQETITNKK